MYRNVRKCTDTYRNVRKCTEIYRNVQIGTEIYRNVHKYTEMYRNVQFFLAPGKLQKNMRISNHDICFKKWLLNVEWGQYSTKYERNNSLLKIPYNFLSNGDLITEMFGKEINLFDISIKNKVILCPLNNNVLKMNNEILSRLNAGSKEYLRNDNITDDANECLQNSIPIEFVNSITPNGFPPHKLILKIGAIIRVPLHGVWHSREWQSNSMRARRIAHI